MSFLYDIGMATTIRFEPILPKRSNFPLDVADRLEKELTNELRGYIRSTLVQKFYRRTANWKTKISISGRLDRRAYKGNLTGFALIVAPAGRHKRIWVFVTRGTKPHVEPRAGVKTMVIRGGVHGYRARTGPGDYYGGPGDYDPDGTFRARQVHHPGIEARDFEKHIVEEVESDFVGRLERAIQRALR